MIKDFRRHTAFRWLLTGSAMLVFAPSFGQSVAHAPGNAPTHGADIRLM